MTYDVVDGSGTYTITDGNVDIDRLLARVLRGMCPRGKWRDERGQHREMQLLADLLDERATERERRLTAGLKP